MSEYNGTPKVEQEKALVAQIVANAENEPTETGLVFRLTYGQKELRISYYNGGFTTTVRNVLKKETHAEQETGLLYQAAKELMQREVEKIGRKTKYKFFTQDPNMTAWAKTTGQTIFNWDGIYDNGPDKPLICEKVFYPTPKETQNDSIKIWWRKNTYIL